VWGNGREGSFIWQCQARALAHRKKKKKERATQQQTVVQNPTTSIRVAALFFSSPCPQATHAIQCTCAGVTPTLVPVRCSCGAFTLAVLATRRGNYIQCITRCAAMQTCAPSSWETDLKPWHLCAVASSTL